jgi:hypothetical protein
VPLELCVRGLRGWILDKKKQRESEIKQVTSELDMKNLFQESICEYYVMFRINEIHCEAQWFTALCYTKIGITDN